MKNWRRKLARGQRSRQTPSHRIQHLIKYGLIKKKNCSTVLSQMSSDRLSMATGAMDPPVAIHTILKVTTSCSYCLSALCSTKQVHHFKPVFILRILKHDWHYYSVITLKKKLSLLFGVSWAISNIKLGALAQSRLGQAAFCWDNQTVYIHKGIPLN